MITGPPDSLLGLLCFNEQVSNETRGWVFAAQRLLRFSPLLHRRLHSFSHGLTLLRLNIVELADLVFV